MRKTVLIITCSFSLLAATGMVPYFAGLETAGWTALAQDEGPALTPSFSNGQDKSNKLDENWSDGTIGEHAESIMPEMNPGEDSPDAPAKATVEGPVEEKAEVQPAEEHRHHPNEAEPSKPADVPEGGKSAADEQSKVNQPAAEQQKRELTPALIALRDKVRRTLALYQKAPLNTRQNTADEIINYCIALGCNTEIMWIEAGGQKRANGIAYLCWNYPCGGFEPLSMVDGHISARLGYGRQSRPGQFLAALALARVQISYPMRVGNTQRTIADLVESEKRSCRSGTDMSLRLVGLSYYAGDESWQNDLGEDWSLEKIVKEELAREAAISSGIGVDRLMGLSYAVYNREDRGQPVEGQFARANIYISDFQKYAFGLQNSDGSWGYFLSGKGGNRYTSAALRSSGYVLDWLAFSLPEDRLDDPAVVSGVGYLVNALSSQQYANNLPAFSAQEIAGATRALHALAVYDERVFKPFDETQQPAEKKPTSTAAKHEVSSTSSRQ